jgi:hypothetical protein
MMQLTVQIAETIRCVVKDIPKTVVVEKQKPATIRQVATDIGIPPILVVFASVNGVKRGINDLVATNAKIHLFGTMAGG